MRALLATGDRETTEVVDVDDSTLDGEVLVDVTHSSINYKDGLAITGRPGVIRDWPKIPGIDLVGTVANDVAGWHKDDRVLVNGWGLGESRHGGLAERARVDAGMLTRVPDAFTDAQAAAIGTAGFTAQLGILALLDAGVVLDSAEVLVTGAAGGVGSITVQLLARAGARVTASTGRVDEEGEWLRSLGALELLDRSELSAPGKPLQQGRWDAALDAVGGVTLANVIAQTKQFGHITACGLAGGTELPSTVMPFILRGVTLHGINSVFQPAAQRDRAWAALADHIDLTALDAATEIVPLGGAKHAADEILAGRIRGRVVVDVTA